MKSIIVTSALSLASILAVAHCSSSDVIDEYRAPGTVSFVFERVAVLVLNGGPDLRASLEDALVAGAKQKHLVAAHDVVSADEMQSAAMVRRKLLDQQFDGVITMRLIRDTEIDAHASEPGVSFSTYADGVPPGEPAFGENQVRIETSVYDLEDEKLLWRGIVQQQVHSDRAAIAREAAGAVRSSLRKTGLVHD